MVTSPSFILYFFVSSIESLTGTQTNWFPFGSSITKPSFHPFGIPSSNCQLDFSVSTFLKPSGMYGLLYNEITAVSLYWL